MIRFHKNPSDVVSLPTDLAARILHEIAIASDAASARISLSFLDDWKPRDYPFRPNRGLGVLIECGRSDSILLVTKPPYRVEFPNTLPTVFEGLAQLMSRMREPAGTVSRNITSLLTEIRDER